MSVAIWLSPRVALLGVVLGSLLSSRTRDRVWRREQDWLRRDTCRAACGKLVAAVRQYRTYVTGAQARIEVWGGRACERESTSTKSWTSVHVSWTPVHNAEEA